MIKSKVAIIGAGPAGLAAAIQLRRYGTPFVLFEKACEGGLLWEANFVENYPGASAGISGPQLARRIVAHAKLMGVRALKERVLRLAVFKDCPDKIAENSSCLRRSASKSSYRTTSDRPAGVFHVITDKNEYWTDYVVVASGTSPCSVPIRVPAECAGQVHSSILPLRKVTGKRIIIVGAGDAGFDYALNLARKRNSVTILNRSTETKCLRLLCERAFSHPLIVYRANWRVSSLTVGETEGTVRVWNEAGETLEGDYLLFAIGRISQVDFLSEELLARPPSRLFLVGDVKNGLCRQAAIAAGEGMGAAMSIHFDMEVNSV